MLNASLKDILVRAQTWPEEDQQRLVQVTLMIEEQHETEKDDLTDEDWAIIDASVESARRGEIASDEEVDAFFAKFRTVGKFASRGAR